MVVPYQCGVDGLNLVLLKRSEARHLAAQVGVHQHLRLGENNRSDKKRVLLDPLLGKSFYCTLGQLIVYQNKQFSLSLMSCNATVYVCVQFD